MGLSVFIVLDKDVIYREVRKITGYTGAKLSSDGSAYAQMAVRDSQHEALDSFWEEAVDVLGNALRKYSIGESRSEVEASFVLEMPGNWAISLEDGLRGDMERYVINYLVGRWNGVVAGTGEVSNTADADALLLQMRTKLNTRRRPMRPRDLRGEPPHDETGVTPNSYAE